MTKKGTVNLGRIKGIKDIKDMKKGGLRQNIGKMYVFGTEYKEYIRCLGRNIRDISTVRCTFTRLYNAFWVWFGQFIVYACLLTVYACVGTKNPRLCNGYNSVWASITVTVCITTTSGSGSTVSSTVIIVSSVISSVIVCCYYPLWSRFFQ